MERRGYGEEYINRYKMMTRFHHQRVPLVILVCGTACTGKSTIATQLAQRLNLPNVLQTDMVYELLRTSTDAPLTSTPVWAREFDSSEEFITEFCRECRIVRKGLAGDLKKAMKDGKPIIIEGIHLDPSIYLMDDDNKLSMKTQPKVEDTKVASDPSVDNSTCQIQNQPADEGKFDSGSRGICGENTSSKELVSSDQAHEVLSSLASVNIKDRVSDDKVENLNETKMDENPQRKKERSGAEPIIVPIVLKMAEFDHEALLEEWIPTRTFSDNSVVKDKEKLMKNLKIIQDYLCSFESQGLTVVNISATTFPQTLDWLHSHLLQCIEQGTSSVSTPKQQSKS
ncbi:hypothetical protein SOVF_076410 isoform B [Spinacia oleracea]|nr:hypothetical protein SOVF_076410 isoform B [Spinacia oleracea]